MDPVKQNPLTMLIASPDQADHRMADAVGRQRRWTVLHAGTHAVAVDLLLVRRPSVVIASDWRPMLEELACLVDPPVLVAASRSADAALWAEALNVGAYDVLQTPLEPGELQHVVESAHETWRRSSALAAWRAMKLTKGPANGFPTNAIGLV